MQTGSQVWFASELAVTYSTFINPCSQTNRSAIKALAAQGLMPSLLSRNVYEDVREVSSSSMEGGLGISWSVMAGWNSIAMAGARPVADCHCCSCYSCHSNTSMNVAHSVEISQRTSNKRSKQVLLRLHSTNGAYNRKIKLV